MPTFASGWMPQLNGDVGKSVCAAIFTVGVLVFIHELGHFLAARMCGMRADVFAIGMGPRLFGWNRVTGFSFGKLPETLQLEGRTDYRVSALPLGGYVKMLGQDDSDPDMPRTQEPDDFRNQTVFKRMVILIAGVVMSGVLKGGPKKSAVFVTWFS